VADGIFQQVDDHLLDEHGLHGQIEDVLRKVQGDREVWETAADGEEGVAGHLLQHLLLFVQRHGAIPDLRDRQQVLHHSDQGVSVTFDVLDQREVFFRLGDLLAGEEDGGCAGDGGQGGAQIVGDCPENVAPDGLPGGLQLNGGLFLVQLGVEFVQCLGILLPLHGLHSLKLDPGGEGAHDAGNQGHADHGHRVAAVTEGEGAVWEHEEVIDAESAYQRGNEAVEISIGQQGNKHD
jgi:hypothetical protein